MDYQLTRARMYADLRAFAKGVFPEYELAPHLQQLMAALMKCEAGEPGWERLMVVMPPRHGKSFTTSEIFPAWFLGRNPNKFVMITSYSGGLSGSFGVRVRENMNHPAFETAFGGPRGVTLDPRTPKRIVMPGYRGGLHVAGVMGGITGRGADLLIIDDPIKDALEAQSPTYRKRTWEWYTSTAYTRLMPGGRVILIQTRWHEDDLAGRILEMTKQSGSETWKKVMLPAVDDGGRALWPERYPVEVLRRIRTTVGPRVWESLYQGRPAPPEGALVKRDWFPIVEVPPGGEAVRRVRYWDFAATEAEESDFTCGLLMSRTPDGIFTIEHVIRFKLSPEKRNRVVRQIAERDYTIHGNAVKIRFEQEGGASGVDMSTSIVRLLAGFDVQPHRPSGSKEARFDPFRAQAESGNIRIARGDWITDYLDEMLAFPYGAHDDQVDCTSGAFNMLSLGMSNFSDYLQSRYGQSDPDVIRWATRFEKARRKAEKEHGRSPKPISDLDLIDSTLEKEIATIVGKDVDRSEAGVSEFDSLRSRLGTYILVKKDVRPSVLEFVITNQFDAEMVTEKHGDDTVYVTSDGNYIIYTRQDPQYIVSQLTKFNYARVVQIVDPDKLTLDT